MGMKSDKRQISFKISKEPIPWGGHASHLAIKSVVSTKFDGSDGDRILNCYKGGIRNPEFGREMKLSMKQDIIGLAESQPGLTDYCGDIRITFERGGQPDKVIFYVD